jgi:hypothetical protein
MEAHMDGSVHVPDPGDPAEALAAVVALRRLAEQLEFAAVDEAIAQGWSWADVAAALGVTRKAAHKRHARRTRSTAPGRSR